MTAQLLPCALKVCTKCKTEKSVAEFSVDQRRKDGRQPWCKECMRACAIQYRAQPAVKARATARQRQRRADPSFREKENEALRTRRATDIEFKQGQKEYWRQFYLDPCNQQMRKERHRNRRTDLMVRAKALLAGARQRDPDCTVTLDHVLAGIKRGHCPVTGILFDLTSEHQRATGRSRNPYSPSIDRIDSRLGYTNENTRIVITHYNFMKGQLTDQEMRFICARVMEFSRL